MNVDLAARSALRGGVFTRADALSAGYTQDEIRARLSNGRWVRLRRGVFSVAPVPVGDPRIGLAVLAVPPSTAALSHESAAALHGLASISAPTDIVHVTIPGAPARRGRRLHVHGRPLPPGSVLSRGGTRTTTKGRTVLDLSRTLPFPAAVVVVDDFLRLHRDDASELARLADAEVGPLSARARRAVAFGDGLSESPGETLSRVAMADCGLPPPRLQVWVGDAEAAIGRVDFFWDRWRTVGEFDGRAKYHSRRLTYGLRNGAKTDFARRVSKSCDGVGATWSATSGLWNIASDARSPAPSDSAWLPDAEQLSLFRSRTGA